MDWYQKMLHAAYKQQKAIQNSREMCTYILYQAQNIHMASTENYLSWEWPIFRIKLDVVPYSNLHIWVMGKFINDISQLNEI